MEGVPRVNVLIDRHHAGLFYALQLLGDRLGWRIYTPVGREWWDAGYWRFGEGYGDERLVNQYLLTDSWSPPGPERDFYITKDHDYPHRAIRGVTLDEARGMCWDKVIATATPASRSNGA
jgi:hypothetical protein